jgi:UDP-2,3-diacylglucosamine pyrophosphatase LpxH
MPARKDFVAWLPAEIAKLRHLSETLGLGSAQAARRLNDEMHGGERVRTATMVNLARSRNGILVNRRGLEPASAESVTQTVNVEDKGDTLEVRTMGSEVTTIDELVARAKIDLTKYEVDRPETSMYETSVRDETGKIRKVQNFRIVARFRLKQGPSTAEQVAALIAGTNFKRPPNMAKVRNVAKVQADLMQAVVIADPHLGKYAYGPETGWGDYDLHIGCRLVRDAAGELLAWGDELRPAVRYIFLLGDILHYDTPHGTTTGGTPQDRDTRLSKMLEDAASTLAGVVEQSATQCETRVVSVAGNHDRVLSVAMQQILGAYFRQSKGVSVDTTSTHRKYVEWGKCLIGLTHGDTARKRLPSLMQVERKEAWGRSICREWHHGHLHREAKDVTEASVTIREHLAICPPDGWHAVEGYVGSPRGMDTFVYDAHKGVRGMWRSPVLDG